MYILRQVNTLDKGFKLSYACKVFHYGTVVKIFTAGFGYGAKCKQELNLIHIFVLSFFLWA